MNDDVSENKKVVIIILNYLNYMETAQCVQSVLKQDYENYHILIMDNGSPNESYDYLRKKYRAYHKISVIKGNKNYGFAKGNNIGIHYARKKLHAEYVLLLNSDTILPDCGYVRKMVASDSAGVGVIGSRIIEGGKRKVRKIGRYVTFPAALFYYLARASEARNNLWLQNLCDKKLKKYKQTFLLQGCVLMLTPAYFGHYEGLDPRTFLYCEEELLYLRCKKVGLGQYLNEDVWLYHEVGQSTKVLYGNGRKGFLKYMLASYKFVLWESFKNYLLELMSIWHKQ